jgi:F-type H+-transporting ATPase subunit gamma
VETLEALGNQIQAVHDLQSVVKTMKGLAAVNIRQYERAVEALRDYTRTVELGMQTAMRDVLDARALSPPEPHSRVAAVVLGSDQGMCGQFNARIAEFAAQKLAEAPRDPGPLLLAIGMRAAAELESGDQQPADARTLPGSVAEINDRVQELVLTISRWREAQGARRVWLFHHRPLSGASYEPHFVQVLPLDAQWLESLRAKPWPGPTLPTFTMRRGAIFAALVRQFLFAALYQGMAASMAAENAARLAAMQAAEKNVEERLDELTTRYHQRRQTAITEELLDVTAGFEVLGQDESAA